MVQAARGTMPAQRTERAADELILCAMSAPSVPVLLSTRSTSTHSIGRSPRSVRFVLHAIAPGIEQ